MALAGGLLAILGVLLSLNRYHGPAWFPIAVASVVGLGTFISNAQGTFAAAKAEKRATARARITKASIATVFTLSIETGIESLVIGVSVFRVRRRLGIWEYLDRVSRFRLGDTPQASTVRWKSGKGTIGACLETGRWQHKDWSAIARRYSGSNLPTRDQFDKLPAAERGGFTYKEFIGIVDKYSEVLAVPIKSVGGAKVVGVIGIDRTYDPALTTAVFDTPKIRVAAEVAAAAIREDVAVAPILES